MSLSTHRILVADDIPDNVLFLQVLLECEGYTVETTISGVMALKIICTKPPELVLLDVWMPDMDGYEVTRLVRQDKRLDAVPIFLITADPSADESYGRHIGANDFIYKPVNPDVLLSRIKRFIA